MNRRNLLVTSAAVATLSVMPGLPLLDDIVMPADAEYTIQLMDFGWSVEVSLTVPSAGFIKRRWIEYAGPPNDLAKRTEHVLALKNELENDYFKFMRQAAG